MENKLDKNVRLSALDAPRYAALARQHGMSNKELLAAMLTYFERTGADLQSTKAGEGVVSSLEKLTKRVDTVISFFKEQEKAILKPMRAELRVMSAAQQASEVRQVEDFARVRRVVVRVIKEGLKPELLNLDSAPFRNSGQ
jgi:transposase-like protein